MLSALKRLLSVILSGLPLKLYIPMRKILRSHHKEDVIFDCDLKRLKRKGLKKDISRLDKVMIIRRGCWDYEYFNVCFLNEVLNICVEAVYSGYIPKIEILTSEGKNLWEEFFLQPFSDYSADDKEKLIMEERLPVKGIIWSSIYDEELSSFFSFLYNTVPVLNKDVAAYINNEIKEIAGSGKVLGVLCRGTDYTATRPAGHPVQPSGEDILNKAVEVFNSGKYEYVYLATEDSRYDRLFRKQFGDRLLTNKRHYYDEVFSAEDITQIKDVHFDRENDDHIKGLEYLSSLKILSKCSGLVAGNCGGTICAVFWNNNCYEDKYVFDLGLY